MNGLKKVFLLVTWGMGVRGRCDKCHESLKSNPNDKRARFFSAETLMSDMGLAPDGCGQGWLETCGHTQLPFLPISQIKSDPSALSYH